jgi:capsular polysaccharide biosynthesis protein
MNPIHEHSDKSISIQELFILLKRYVLIILAAGLLGGILTHCLCNMFLDPVYEANAKMIVNSRQEQNGSLTNDQITSSQKLVNTYAIIIRSQPVLEPVIDNLGLSMDAEALSKKVMVTSVNETQVMQIAVQSKDPDQALRILEQIISICPEIIIEAVEAGSVKTIEPAHLKKNPVAPSTNLYTLVAAFLCMIAVVLVVLLRFLLDNTYKSEVDLRNDLGLPVLGVIPDYECCLKQKNDGKEVKYYGKA